MATLIGLLGDFDLAEEYAQEAFAAALHEWPSSGVGESPRGYARRTADPFRPFRRSHPPRPAGSNPDVPCPALRSDCPARVDAAPRCPAQSRVDAAGDLVLLENQDRTTWNHPQIAEALTLVAEALRGTPGPYALQAAIAAEHCRAARAEDTNWRRIASLYQQLHRLQPSPIVLLNRAAAVAMAEGPRSGLALVDELGGDLDHYHLFHAARADLLRRIGSRDQAAQHYARALELVTNDRERRYLRRRLQEVS